MSKSWKPEVWVYNATRWDGNACRFATEEEAKEYVKDLSMRWTQVDKTRVVESDDPVSCKLTDPKDAGSLEWLK